MRLTLNSLLPSTRGRFLALAASLLLAAPALAGDPPSPKVRETTDTFRSGGKDVTVERFAPAADGKYPALLLIHAIDGLDNAYGDFYRGLARDYAARGYAVSLVHYFDRTAGEPGNPKVVRELFLRRAAGKDLTPEQHDLIEGRFDVWTDTVADAVTDVRRQANVDGDRVGLAGFSMGGFLALSAAAREDLKVAAVVDVFGGLPAERRAGVETLPPTLVLHGDRDHVVPVEEARALDRFLTERKLVGEVKVYEGVGHVFMDDNGRVTLKAAAALVDARSRTALFLAKHLQAARTVTARPN
jgi:carboxymethylenebutenolidase